MSFALTLGVVLLATFGLASLLLAGLVATAWRAGLNRVRTASADLLALRLLPVAGGLLFAVTVVLPAFLSYEPHRDREVAGPLLLILAAFALLTLGHGIWRGWRAWAAARSLLQRMNERHLDQHPGDGKLAARIASYELAARMQLSVPEISDLSTEPAHILKLYGADDTANANKAGFARNCILARRLIERGVRFVQLFNGAYASGGELNWDGHNKLKEQYDRHAEVLDQPAAALIRDLRQRGLLEDTLVVWGSEFGRTPYAEKNGTGRDHNPAGFTVWLAGGGVKPGFAHGTTDDFGHQAVADKVHMHDLHASILALMGLDHEKLTYFSQGRDYRLTDVEGRTELAKVLAR